MSYINYLLFKLPLDAAEVIESERQEKIRQVIADVNNFKKSMLNRAAYQELVEREIRLMLNKEYINR